MILSEIEVAIPSTSVSLKTLKVAIFKYFMLEIFEYVYITKQYTYLIQRLSLEQGWDLAGSEGVVME